MTTLMIVGGYLVGAAWSFKSWTKSMLNAMHNDFPNLEINSGDRALAMLGAFVLSGVWPVSVPMRASYRALMRAKSPWLMSDNELVADAEERAKQAQERLEHAQRVIAEYDRRHGS